MRRPIWVELYLSMIVCHHKQYIISIKFKTYQKKNAPWFCPKSQTGISGIKNANFDNTELRDARLVRINLVGSSFYNIYRGSLDIANMKAIEGINSELETIKKQLQTLVASLAQKDAEIAEFKKLPPNEQVQEGRAGSVVLTVDPNGNNITLGLTIEQSDNLIEWTKLDGEMTRTIPIPDGKKFYRFALDK